MSDTNTPSPETLENRDPGQAGGSPSDLDQENLSEEEHPEGDTSGDDGSDSGTVSEDDRFADLEQRLRERDEELNNLRTSFDIIERDPVAGKHARRVLLGERAQGPDAEDRIQQLANEKFGKLDKEGAWAKAMTDFGRTVREEALQEARREFGDKFAAHDQALSSSALERALIDQWVDPEALRTPEFRSFVKDNSKGTVKQLLRHPSTVETAAEVLAGRWDARRTKRDGYRAENRRLERSKGGRLNSTSQRGSGGAKETIDVSRNDPRRAAKLVDLAFRKGVDPRQINFK